MRFSRALRWSASAAMAAALFLPGRAEAAPAAVPAPPPGWTLTWSDDFNGCAGCGVDTGNWIYDTGTGFGTGLYLDGRLGPHLELSHHPFRKGETYDEQLGNAARKDVGKKQWNKRVKKAIDNLRALTNFDHLYIGGGNAKKIDFELDPDVTIVSNEAGIRGGVALWQD